MMWKGTFGVVIETAVGAGFGDTATVDQQLSCITSPAAEGSAAMAIFQSPVRMSVVVGDSSIWAAFFLGRSVGKSNNCAKMSRKYIFIIKYNVEERNNRFLWVIAK